MVFPKGFRLTSMLTKLMKVFVYPPKFSWNHVCRGKTANCVGYSIKSYFNILYLLRETVFV